MTNPKNDVKSAAPGNEAVELTESELDQASAAGDGTTEQFYMLTGTFRPSPNGDGTTEQIATGKRQHKPIT